MSGRDSVPLEYLVIDKENKVVKHIYNKAGTKLIKDEEAEPKCGEDFCDSCGDCLSCAIEDKCFASSDGLHFWVEYSVK